ncbi:UvrD-helicase domain-containing protein [Methylobacterium sp. SD274]|uniref:UvrD-helicase domain-containing protein n=1 Tax=Methylobacterium sp. SD274 TaxID=2782009 RepID=UPI001A976863|nr:UvrD-helicase domain-containing protein [Methylobacterium sp. SD274]MBO1022875.1 UvrD-helicase domain-containing protein [Methylobacterium sp. SD274]
MTVVTRNLPDQANRIIAMTAHDRSLLVEAGAGSGKTAIMAGRVAMMLVSGIRPRHIAAVTFTELAASELLARIRQFVDELSAGRIPVELGSVIQSALDRQQKANLDRAGHEIDEITCSTIHGFCQRLIKPYPAEANIDPGASVADRNDADFVFMDLRDAWIRDRLGANGSPLLIEMVAVDPNETLGAIERVSDCMRRSRELMPPPSRPISEPAAAFNHTVSALRAFIDRAPCLEPDLADIITAFETLAAAVAPAETDEGLATLVRLVNEVPGDELCTTTGGFRSYRRKGAWATAAAKASLSKAEGERLFAEADGLYKAAGEAWTDLISNAASRLLALLMTELQPLIEQFRTYKRDAALLDFDDLIEAARNLLRNHEPVRQALANRYAHVLVDEFQDTDPLQSEIFWRLCGDDVGESGDWSTRALRPGALFLVGDPKQAIYRFRGADVRAYVAAREAIIAQDPANVLSIATNFRSCRSILEFVNGRFETPLSVANNQPGFTALDHWHADRGTHPCVAALDFEGPVEKNPEASKAAEAEAVAELCARLIGSHQVRDHKTGEARLCRPGDIALLAPTGNGLWRFEEALERRGVPVATQAGKGFFWRQEIQDLIALTRVLADPRDTLALGALLRGPLVGLTDEVLLDIVWALPRKDGEDGPGRLTLWADLDHVGDPVAKDALARLQGLAMRGNATTPHNLLSQAIAELHVRPTLLVRHQGQAERALANVDLYLTMARPYAIRGLRAFAEAMTSAWEDEGKAGEGRPDAQEESVSLYTIHAAKGLEWPLVIPVNTSTGMMNAVGAVIERGTSCLYCKIFGVAPGGYEQASSDEKDEIARERVRLWYVAATRSRELLILPRSSSGVDPRSWLGVVDLMIGDLPSVDVAAYDDVVLAGAGSAANDQSHVAFASEGAVIASVSRGLTWKTPSNHRDADKIDPVAAEPTVIGGGDASEVDDVSAVVKIQGGRERGLVMHKLFEEVLTGELSDDQASLAARAAVLICELGRTPADDPGQGCNPAELAGSVVRALNLPEIASVRPSLIAECQIYAYEAGAEADTVTFGIADAIGFINRQADLVIDWKSDVAPDDKTVAGYRQQVRDYLRATSVKVGLIVFPTSGRVERVVL